MDIAGEDDGGRREEGDVGEEGTGGFEGARGMRGDGAGARVKEAGSEEAHDAGEASPELPEDGAGPGLDAEGAGEAGVGDVAAVHAGLEDHREGLVDGRRARAEEEGFEEIGRLALEREGRRGGRRRRAAGEALEDVLDGLGVGEVGVEGGGVAEPLEGGSLAGEEGGRVLSDDEDVVRALGFFGAVDGDELLAGVEGSADELEVEGDLLGRVAGEDDAGARGREAPGR
jgi:hypothetical protein